MSGRAAAAWADEEIAKLEAAGLRRTLETLSSAQGAVVRVGDRELVNFSSNDYLGLAAHPFLAEAAAKNVWAHGTGTGASRLIVGTFGEHEALEAQLAALFESSALVFNSGYAANVGILSTLAGAEDAIFSDALNHASIIDGCRLSRAKTIVYPHRDVDALDALLAKTDARRRIVVTDAIFSMDGDRAPLREIAEICERHGAALVVDEAHAFGLCGSRGRGLCDELGLAERVDVRMGTFGKAAGAFGAFVVASRAITEWLKNKARSFVFSTSLPPMVCAAASEGVRLLSEDSSRREHLWSLVEQLSSGLQSLGYDAQPRSPIFPIVLGTPENALDASHRLRERGLLVKAIRPPTVPPGTSRLRVSLSAAHTREHVTLLLEGLKSLEFRDARCA